MILGVATTKVGRIKGKTPTDIMQDAVVAACEDANIKVNDLEGLFANIAAGEPRGMQAHFTAQQMGLIPAPNGKTFISRTIETGGSSGVTALIDAYQCIMSGKIDVAAVTTSDLTMTMPLDDMLHRLGHLVQDPSEPDWTLPVIPRLYNRVAEHHMQNYGTTREQLAMASVVMSRQAAHHPQAMGYKKPVALDDVLNSLQVDTVTSLWECSRRADGGNAVILVSQKFAESRKIPPTKLITITGWGEGSGALRPTNPITEDMFALSRACQQAYQQAGKTVKDIDFFGLYDCFPITLIRAVEDVGLVPRGQGGPFFEKIYNENAGLAKPLNINTHGGLMHYAAPGSAAALYNVVESVMQMRGKAPGIKVPNVNTCLCYGNGGVFTATAVVILENGNKLKPAAKL